MCKLVHTVSVRLSDRDLQRFKRVLARYGRGFSDSDRFRSMLCRLDRVAAHVTPASPSMETAAERKDRQARAVRDVLGHE